MSNQASENSILNDVINKDIIDLLGLTNVTPEKQEEYRKKATETIFNDAMSVVADLLVEQNLMDEFEKVGPSEEEKREFLLTHDIDFDQVLFNSAIAYKAKMKTVADMLDAGVTLVDKAKES